MRCCQAALGGVAGGAVPAIAKGVGAIAKDFAKKRAGKAAGIEPETADILRSSIEADLPTAGARLSRAGGDAMVADMGPNMRALLDTAIQRSGPAGTKARAAIDDRVTVASQNIDDAFNRTLGRPEGARTLELGVKDKAQPAISAAYREAYGSPIDYASDAGVAIEQIVKNRVPPGAIRKANAIMRAEGATSKQIKVSYDKDGGMTYEALPDIRQIDYITRGLNDFAEGQAKGGAAGGLTTEGRVIKGRCHASCAHWPASRCQPMTGRSAWPPVPSRRGRR